MVMKLVRFIMIKFYETYVYVYTLMVLNFCLNI